MTTLDVTEFAPPGASRFASRGAGLGLAEFLVVGGATFLLFPLAWLCRTYFGLDRAELAVGFLTFHAAHAINDPHFAVTYLLFYKDVRRRATSPMVSVVQRARFWVSGLVVPLALVAWASAAIAMRSAPALGWLFQSMLLLVGWHYGKQGFGVLVVLAGRRGVRFDALERRAYLFHVYAAWAYAWASPADPGTELEARGVVYTSLAHGLTLERVAFAVFALSAAGLVAALVRRRLRSGAWLPIAPVAVFLATVWLWTVYTHVDPLMVYVIPALHSLQYLYLVGVLKRNELRADDGAPFVDGKRSAKLALFALSAIGLGWLVFHGAPELLDAVLFTTGRRRVDLGNLGLTPCFAAAFACVNIHHYFMDSVIWRRENPEMRHLNPPASTQPAS